MTPSGTVVALRVRQENQTMKPPSLPILVVDGVVSLQGKFDNPEIPRAAGFRPRPPGPGP